MSKSLVYRILLLILLMGMAMPAAWAHSEQESPAQAEIFPQRTFLMVRITGTGSDLTDAIQSNAHSLTAKQAGSLSPQTRAAAREYFDHHFMLKQGGQRLRGEFLSLRLWTPDGVDASQMRFEARIRFQRDASLVDEPLFVTNALFDYLGKAQTIIKINGAVKTLDKGQTTSFNAALATRGLTDNLQDWAQSGFLALFGWEHFTFILAVLLAAAHLPVRQVVEAMAAVTLAMGAAFSVALMRQISPSMAFIGVGISLSILCIGIFNWLLARRAGTEEKLDDSSSKTGFALFLLATVFGAVHGFRFLPSVLENGLPEEGLGMCLLAFVAGSAVAQVLFCVAGAYLLQQLRHRFNHNAKYGGMDWNRATQLISMVFVVVGAFRVLESWFG